jgi:ParB-like chromosome segregation protein Spo0J
MSQRRRRGEQWMSERQSKTEPTTPRQVPLCELCTSLGRARFLQSAQVKRMVTSLSSHGQMSAVIVVERGAALELVDGFKRRAAAMQLGWKTLLSSVRTLDERAQWVAMLTLNRTPGSLSVLEEALILRELVLGGMTQTEVAQLVGRHKSWASRRLGLIERLHPELLEWVRTGLLSPGTARRLFVLPAGNQLEMAAVVTQQGLSTQETELLVSLWHKATDAEVRRFLLKDPRTALQHAKPDDPRTPTDPRLTPRGQTLQRSLRILLGVATKVIYLLRPRPSSADLEILAPEMSRLTPMLPSLAAALGSASKSQSSGESSETSATSASTGFSPRDTASRPPHARPAST